MVPGVEAASPALTGDVTVARRSRGRALSRLLSAHGLLAGAVCLFAGVVALRLPQQVTQDTWLSLVGGRFVAHHGIPGHDVLTAWTLGERWVDQQWLSQLTLYGLYALGGFVLLGILQVLFLGGSVAMAAGYGRRRGAAARTMTWLLVGTIYPVLLAAGNIRTQTLVLPLFVAVLVLLVDDVRRPSARVFVVLPLLVLWANLHGSVVIAAGLAVLRGLLGLRDAGMRRRSLVLAGGAAAAVFVTPFGAHIVDYYHATLINPSFRSLVTEWGPPTPNLVNAPIYLLAGAAIWLLARHTRTIGAFGVLTELALIALSLGSIRSVLWLGLASIVLLAPALDAELGGRELSVERMNRGVALLGAYFVVFVLVAVLWHGDARLVKAYPAAAGDTVARLAAAAPGTRIYSNEHYGDWLLFQHPELAGRVDFDARFELMSTKQLARIFAWTNQITDHWRRAAAGSHVIVLDPSDEQRIVKTLRQDRTLRQAVSDRHIAVFVRK